MDRDLLRQLIRKNVQLTYSRASGPGGQNVNKRDTKVTAKLVLSSLNSVDEASSERMYRRLAPRISGDGNIVLQTDGERSQARNREAALERMERLLWEALRPAQRPRKPSKPSKAARERRLTAKHHRSRQKAYRKREQLL